MAPQPNQRVDPRPVKPPALGLISSANNVVVDSDTQIPNERVNPDDVYSDIATGPSIPVTDDRPASDIERPGVGHPVLWVRGFSYRPEVCVGGDIIDPEGTGIGAPPALQDTVSMVPYVVEGVDQRPTFGAATPELRAEAQGYARRQLLACESSQIEAELWKGTLTKSKVWGNRYLAAPDVWLPEGDRLLGYLTALAVLEQTIATATCGQQGMIHCRADTATYWVSEHLVHREGNILVTELGTIVVAGSGYDGSAPDIGTPGLDPKHADAAFSADSAWAYATTVVDVRRSAFMPPQQIEERAEFRNTHQTLTTYERRVAAATWGCLHSGVHVDHINLHSTTGS